MKFNDDNVIGLAGCFGILFVMIVSMVLNAFTFPYVINTWLIHFGKVPVVLWWHGLLIGFVPGIGQLGLILALITWIATLFI
jgi:hypothetical protein